MQRMADSAEMKTAWIQLLSDDYAHDGRVIIEPLEEQIASVAAQRDAIAGRMIGILESAACAHTHR